MPDPIPDVRASVVANFGKYCTYCGDRRAQLKVTRIHQGRPETFRNAMLICQSCAERERPGLFEVRPDRNWR